MKHILKIGILDWGQITIQQVFGSRSLIEMIFSSQPLPSFSGFFVSNEHILRSVIPISESIFIHPMIISLLFHKDNTILSNQIFIYNKFNEECLIGKECTILINESIEDVLDEGYLMTV